MTEIKNNAAPRSPDVSEPSFPADDINLLLQQKQNVKNDLFA